MNEFNAQTGGRYVYVDDVLNLQDLALAFGRVFDGCDNFIISGCEVSGSTIGSGYVYLNGKIRYFSGASGITSWPQYLYEKNTAESVNYASGDAKVGRNVYGVTIGSSVPTAVDALTGKVPVSMTISQTGGMLMKDAFFGKYALVLNAASLSQVLNGTLKIDGDFEVTGAIRSLKNRYRIVEAQATFDAFFNSGNLTLQSKYETSGKTYALSMEDGVGVCTYVDGTLVSRTNADGIYLPGSIQASQGALGCVGIDTNGVYNRTEAADDGALNINMVGLNGASQYYRNTVIGNGKGAAVVTVNGQSQTMKVDGVVTVASSTVGEGLVFSLDKPKSSADIQKTILWKDSDSETIGIVGFTDNADSSFRITNNVAGVYVYGATNSFVDLGPAIKENGQLLTDKYVQLSNYNATLGTLAKIDNTYSKTESDARYSKVADGFDGYVSAGNTKESLRQQIEAASTSDLSNYLSKASLLSDVATDDDAKKQIRTNIGAPGYDEVQAKQKDSGWIELLDTGLYIRQIGNIVSIQGIMKSITEGTAFTIPNTIDPPTYAVAFSTTETVVKETTVFGTNQLVIAYTVGIGANSRECKVLYSNGQGFLTNFSMTYMV